MPKKINSKSKGKSGELEFAHFCTDHGFPSRRGVQYKGSPGSPDVEGLKGIHIEVKRTEKLSLYEAMEQAGSDKADSEMPIVAHRRNHKPWVIIMDADDWFEMFKAWQKEKEK